VIAVRRSGLTAEQKRALAIYDNRTAELATWNLDQLLADVGNGLPLQPWWTPEEEALLLKAQAKQGRTDPDEVPAERPTDIQRGDLFELGKHRLRCGDCTDRADVTRLFEKVSPLLMVTDPPYGVAYDASWRSTTEGLWTTGQPVRDGPVLNDETVDWTAAWALFPGDVAYVWHASQVACEVAQSLKAHRFEIRAQIVWNKPRFIISRGHYHWKHEPCWYVVRAGKTAHWVSEDRTQSTVWDIALSDSTGTTTHSTQKPVECMRRPIENHGGPDDDVYEPFSGSGTTLIAAEQVNRRCLAIELNPTYVQMAIDRFEAFTTFKARKVGETVRA
jgi:DNA modification methylase